MSDQPASQPDGRPAPLEVQPQSVEGLFLTALALETPAERQAFLDQVCGDDAARRRRIEALLRAYDDAGSFLERPAVPVDAAETYDFLQPADKPGCLGRLGYYEVIDVIGRGGMGIVFRALDPRLNRIVAIKVLAPELAASPLARRRFLREAQAAAAVSHPHVVTIHGVDEAKLPYLVMECIVGQSLQQKLDRVGPLRLAEILRIGSQIAEGLAAAHRQGLIHRDIKPANILLENGVERVKITDFGLARAADDAAITRTGEVSGTPQYMSPEQARGDKVDSRSDLFSLGCVLYAMCTGRSPFRADSVAAAIRRVCDDAPRPIGELNSEIPTWLVDLVDMLLAKSPDERFQTAEEIATALERCLKRLQRPDEASLTEWPRRAPAEPASTADRVAAPAPAMAPVAERAEFRPAATAIVQLVGQVAFAAAAGFLLGLVVFANANDFAVVPIGLMAAGLLASPLILETARIVLKSQERRSHAIAVRCAWTYAACFGLLRAMGLLHQEVISFEVVAVLAVLGLISLVVLSQWIGRTVTAADAIPEKAGRQLAWLGVALWALLFAWFLGIAAQLLPAVPLDSHLQAVIGQIAMAIVCAGGLILLVGLILQQRMSNTGDWAYLARLMGFGALMAAGLLAVASLVYVLSTGLSLGPIEVLILVLVVSGAVTLYWRIAGARRGQEPPVGSGKKSRRPILLAIVPVAGLLMALTIQSWIPQLFPGPPNPIEYATPVQPTLQTADRPVDSGMSMMGGMGGGDMMGGMPGGMPADGAMGGMPAMGGAMMMGMPGEGGLGAGVMMGGAGGFPGAIMQPQQIPVTTSTQPINDQSMGAMLLDFGQPPLRSLSFDSSGRFLSSGRKELDRAVQLLGFPAPSNEVNADVAALLKIAQTGPRSVGLRDAGIFQVPVNEYRVLLYDWRFGWMDNTYPDPALLGKRNGGVPAAAVRFLTQFNVQAGEIATLSAGRDNVQELLRGILESTPALPDGQLKQFLWNDEIYVLTAPQARVVRELLRRCVDGQRETAETDLLAVTSEREVKPDGDASFALNPLPPPESPGDPFVNVLPQATPKPQPVVVTSVQALFNDGKHPAWGPLIVPGDEAGTFSLNSLDLGGGRVVSPVPEKPVEAPADATVPMGA